MMPSLAQHIDADRLIQAIRQDPVPSHAASLAVAAVEAALQAVSAAQPGGAAPGRRSGRAR